MATKEQVKKYIDNIVNALNDVGPDLLVNWGGSVQFVISDLKTGWLIKMALDGSVEKCVETTNESGAGVLEMDSDSFVGIYSKKIDFSQVKASGKMKVRGATDDLRRVMPMTL